MCLQSSPPEPMPLPSDWQRYLEALQDAALLLDVAHQKCPEVEDEGLIEIQQALDRKISTVANAAEGRRCS